MLFCFQVWLLLLLQMWWGFEFWTYVQTLYYWRVSIWNSLHVILTKLYICIFFVLKLYMCIHMFYKVFYKKSLKVNHKELIKIFLTIWFDDSDAWLEEYAYYWVCAAICYTEYFYYAQRAETWVQDLKIWNNSFSFGYDHNHLQVDVERIQE
jgi:hypothetical protein